MRYYHILLLCLLITLGACTSAPDRADYTPEFHRTHFSKLPGWENDNMSKAFDAMYLSCERILKRPPKTPLKPIGYHRDFQPACRAANALKMQMPSPKGIRTYFETWFTPYNIRAKEDKSEDGLFTGYYEAALNGSLTRYGPYQTPLYGLPAGYDKNKTYPERADIERRGINAPVIAWVDDPVDAFFLHIQGSGIVQLDTGGTLRVGYAGKNGHAYFAIGRALIERGHVKKEDMSMQAIRAWLNTHPQDAHALMNLNKSYVFFRSLETSGPVGAQGVTLTPKRSLAIDKRHLSYGLPLWVMFDHPTRPPYKIAQLMIAQDTGGAIKGPVRGDVFWGYGERAEKTAGLMKSRGRYWALLPKKLARHKKIP